MQVWEIQQNRIMYSQVKRVSEMEFIVISVRSIISPKMYELQFKNSNKVDSHSTWFYKSKKILEVTIEIFKVKLRFT